MKWFAILALTLSLNAHAKVLHTDWETIAPSQTLQTCGPTGSQGDILERLIIIPITTSPGTVTVSGDTGVSFDIFQGGTVSDLSPIVVEVGALASGSDGWRVSTGANVHAVCVGRFQ